MVLATAFQMQVEVVVVVIVPAGEEGVAPSGRRMGLVAKFCVVTYALEILTLRVEGLIVQSVLQGLPQHQNWPFSLYASAGKRSTATRTP